jgi:hypothetical protein
MKSNKNSSALSYPALNFPGKSRLIVRDRIQTSRNAIFHHQPSTTVTSTFRPPIILAVIPYIISISCVFPPTGLNSKLPINAARIALFSPIAKPSPISFQRLPRRGGKTYLSQYTPAALSQTWHKPNYSLPHHSPCSHQPATSQG